MENVKKWILNNSGYDDDDGRGNGDGWGYSYGCGYGCGDGFGDGYGCGYGCGDGCGWGSGNDDGYGFGYSYGWSDGCGNDDGSGYGRGYGYGIGKVNNKSVYQIDTIPTIIEHILGNVAKGYMLNIDLTLTPCYIAKGNGHFAHGETLTKAVESLRSKIFESMNPDEAISAFLEKFDPNKTYTGHDFYKWHHYLTGSCEMGRNAFVKARGIDLDDTFSVDEFIDICINEYGGEIIQELKTKWDEKERDK